MNHTPFLSSVSAQNTPPATLPRQQPQPSSLQQPIAIPPPIQPIPTHPPPQSGGVGASSSAPKPDEYIPLESCFSDQNNSINPANADEDPLSSIPAGMAPPKPPLPVDRLSLDRVEYDHPSSKRTVDPNENNIYKSPPSNRPLANAPVSMQSPHDSVYKVPPKREPVSVDYINQQDMSSEDDGIYNVPPSHHQSVYNTPPPPISSARTLKREPSERDSNSSNGSKHSQLATDDSGLGSSMDNITRGMRETGMGHMKAGSSQYQTQQQQQRSESQEIYNVPPPTRPTVPAPADNHKLLHAVPPPANVGGGGDQRPKESNRAQYVNLYGSGSTGTGKPEVPLPASSAACEYDIPPSSRKRSDVEMLGLHPPPPNSCAIKVTSHAYVNAGTGVVSSTSNPMRVPVSPSSQSGTLTRTKQGYIPMNKAAEAAASTSPDSYLPMAPLPPTDSYSLMDNQNSPSQESYMPMDGTGSSPQRNRRQRGSRGSGSHSPDNYIPMDNTKDAARYSTDSTYQVLPPGVHPVPGLSGQDYDNRFSQMSDIYSSGPSNIPVLQPQPQQVERDSIYSYYPSNKPVVEAPKPLKGLDTYVPTSATPSPRPRRPTLDAYPPAPAVVRESDLIYDSQPSNVPVVPIPGG